jgi:excisionase family DNA binding protein
MQEKLPFLAETGEDTAHRPENTRDVAARRSKGAGGRERGRGVDARGASPSLGGRKLSSVEDAAVFLDTSRATLYWAIKRGELPLPLFTIGRRLRIPRAAVERLLAGGMDGEGCGPGKVA